MEFFSKFFKNLLLWNRWSDFEIISQNMFLGWPFSKIDREILIRQNLWLWWMGGYLHYTEIKEFFNNLLLWNCWLDFGIISQICSLGDPFQKLFVKFGSIKNVALVNGGYLHYTEIKEFFKNLLLWNRWSDFEIISQGCSLGDPFQNSFVKYWSIKKCGPGEWGLLALYRNEGILKKSSSLKPLVRFWNNFTELFLGWPFSKFVREILIGEETWLWWMGATCTIGKWGNS